MHLSLAFASNPTLVLVHVTYLFFDIMLCQSLNCIQVATLLVGCNIGSVKNEALLNVSFELWSFYVLAKCVIHLFDGAHYLEIHSGSSC